MGIVSGVTLTNAALPRARFSIPQVAGPVVPRERLVERVIGLSGDSGSSIPQDPPVRIVQLNAPPGFGKTTLMSLSASRLLADGRSVAWLSIPPGASVELAWATFESALMNPEAAAGQPVKCLAVDLLPRVAREELGERVARAAAQIPAGMAVFVDDSHELDPAFRDALVAAMAYAPAGVLLVLAGRLPAGVRPEELCPQVAADSIGPMDLLFSVDDTRQLWSQHGTDIAREEAEGLVAATEGWPAALRVLAMWDQCHRKPQAAQALRQGSHSDAQVAVMREPVALSGRESAILRELATTRTLAEIAVSGSVSLNTVKSHVRAIYAKLGVRSRRDAVASAHERKLM